MDDKIFAPFSQAAADVLKLMMDLDATQHSLSLSEDKDDITIHIGLIGDVNGDVAYRFPKSTALELVKIMCGMEISEVDEFVTSALGEIANIISGNAATGLTENSVACDILPPRFGSDKSFDNNGNGVTISTSAGDMELRMSFDK